MGSDGDYWMYRADSPTPGKPAGVNMTSEQWEQLSPGYRRTIVRVLERNAELPSADRAMLRLKGMV